jgi:hypothetical protein
LPFLKDISTLTDLLPDKTYKNMYMLPYKDRAFADELPSKVYQALTGKVPDKTYHTFSD